MHAKDVEGIAGNVDTDQPVPLDSGCFLELHNILHTMYMLLDFKFDISLKDSRTICL